MTGAEWLKTRFGTGRGAQLSHVIVIVYALICTLGFFSYGFKGIGKFAATFLDPTILCCNGQWHPSPNMYALVLISITAIYVIKGGMISVVITEVVQFCHTGHRIVFSGNYRHDSKMAPGALRKVVPAGWDSVFFGWHLNMDWSALIPSANAKIAQDGYGLFGFFVIMLLFKGVLISAAGPPPATICSVFWLQKIRAKPR